MRFSRRGLNFFTLVLCALALKLHSRGREAPQPPGAYPVTQQGSATEEVGSWFGSAAEANKYREDRGAREEAGREEARGGGRSGKAR